MAIATDFALFRGEHGTLNVSMAPATNISGWSLEFVTRLVQGGESGLITRSTASGFSGSVSGIVVTNGAQGVFQVSIPRSLTSGWDYRAYPFEIARTDSGFYNILAQGHLVVKPAG